MKLGIFFCTCNNTVDIDFRAIKKGIKKEVEVVETHDLLCQGGLDYIMDDLRRLELDGIIIGACTEKKRIFERVTAGFSCDIFFLNLREQCGWVHGRKEATEKAKSMVETAISSAEMSDSLPRPEKITFDAGYDVLVIGDEMEGALEVAKILSQVATVYLVTNNVHEWCDEPEIHIGSLKGIKGEIGNFEVEIERSIDLEKCISCGLCSDTCPKDAIRYDTVYIIDEKCNECGECIEMCPTGAIVFNNHNRETIHVGQILVIGKEWQGSTQFGIYRADDYKDALKKAHDIVLHLGEIEKERYLVLKLTRCASGKSELNGCEYCLPCPYEAIRKEGVKMVFSDVRCQGCGLCVSLCPLSVPQLRGYPYQFLYSQIETLLSGNLDSKVLLFACSAHIETLNVVGKQKIRYPPILPLIVPCIAIISEVDILHAFELGADGVILWGCEQCQSHRHREQLEAIVHFAQIALSAFNLGERVLLISDAPFDAEYFANTITNFVETLSPSPIRNKKPVARAIDFAKPKRDILLEVVQNLYIKTQMHPTLKEENTSFPFADLSINARCTLCNACVNLCPTNALDKDDNKINFVYGLCIACGLCEQACSEEAIELTRLLDFSLMVEKRRRKLFEAELVACAECGKLFMSKSAFKRISSILKECKGTEEFNVGERLKLLRYCEKCRATKAIDLFLKMEHK